MAFIAAFYRSDSSWFHQHLAFALEYIQQRLKNKIYWEHLVLMNKGAWLKAKK